MPNLILKTPELRRLVEPFVFEELNCLSYEILELPPVCLLTWNRFDLAFKLVYLDLKEKNYDFARQVYGNDIRSQTLGSFEEYGSDSKNTFEKYVSEFEKTYKSIRKNGFDKESTLIPLSDAGTIINGAHRVAAAIRTNQIVSCFKTEQSSLICDYKYFFNRNVPTTVLDLVANKFIEYADNVHIAFLWPSGISNLRVVESEFTNIVYKKQISMTARGGFNLIVELYKHMDWIGTAKSNFSGAQRKLIECFPTFDPVTVIVFQSDSIENVKQIKDRVRQKINIGFSSVHITDTKEEVIRISKLIFNENGIHFLNFAETQKYLEPEGLSLFKVFLDKNGANPKDVLVDGSLVLSLYGIRKNRDVDYLTLDNASITLPEIAFEPHDSELVYHQAEKCNLIYNPLYFFEYLGLKFVSFYQLYDMKVKRSEEKDGYDLKLMRSFIEKDRTTPNSVSKKQSLFYFKIKCKKWVKDIIMLSLSALGIYKPVRSIYRKLKGRIQ